MKDSILKAEKRFARLSRALSILLAAWMALFAGGCYIPGLNLLGEADDPPSPGDPSGIEETYYGKFIIYQVANGKVYTLSGSKVDYFVGDEVFFPSNDPSDSDDYNINSIGSDRNITFKYKDQISDIPAASSSPEGIVLDGQLALFYTNWRNPAFTRFLPLETTCGGDVIGDTFATAYDGGTAILNRLRQEMINSPTDKDVYKFYLEDPWTVVQLSGYFKSFRATLNYTDNGDDSETYHSLQLSLYDASGQLIARSTTGVDYWRYNDPSITANLAGSTSYYLEVEDPGHNPCVTLNEEQSNTYTLVFDTTYKPSADYVMKGEIQPARSGSPKLSGGPTFEPDDLTTEIVDDLPDCDGVPGTGDEGDAGIEELCGDIPGTGAGDGKIQYQEADDRYAIDDGEYFIGKQTNIPALRWSEASVIKAPDRKTLLMFVNFGSAIYMLESLDGYEGKQWDLFNVANDQAAVKPLNYSTSYVPDPSRLNNSTPTVSSGPLGYCESKPGAGDGWPTAEQAEYANQYGDSLMADNTSRLKAPTGYPGENVHSFPYAVTFGDNQQLDSPALKDTLMASGTTIDSGPDGIINTLFAPKFIAYTVVPAYFTKNPTALNLEEPIIEPSDPRLQGPGNVDNPSIGSATEFLITSGNTLEVEPFNNATYNGSDKRAYLLGPNDHWIDSSFVHDGETLYPARYMRQNNCTFYNLGNNFERCAMGVPVDPATGEEPVSIDPGKNGKLDTVNAILAQDGGDDVLCHEGDTVGICPGPDGRFDFSDIYIPLKGDDRLDFVWDGNTSYKIKSIIYDNSPDSIKNNMALYPDFPTPGKWVVGVHPGDNGILETSMEQGTTATLLDSYTVFDFEDNTVTLIVDHLCTISPASSVKAICPGLEIIANAYLPNELDSPYPWEMPPDHPIVRRSKKLITIWPMYMGSKQWYNIDYGDPYKRNFQLFKRDVWDVYDDYFCDINGQVAICPGENGYFQAYTLGRKNVIDEADDPFTLYEDNKSVVGKDCYSMEAETILEDIHDDEETVYRIYKFQGLKGDDKIKWDNATQSYYVSTGRNGINQSCTIGDDVNKIGFNKGLPYAPIISDGGDGFETYPMADEKVYWGDGVYKVGVGKDGIANSYAMGDDLLDILFGTGKPDSPCAVSMDGISDTKAQGNDTQLYDPGVPDLPGDGQYTGFDAFQVWGPEVIAKNGKLYLYYSALGFETLPEQLRESSGALGGKGECKRSGLDAYWGNFSSKKLPYPFVHTSSDTTYSYYGSDRDLRFPYFRAALDDNEGVYMAPRIGVAVSTIARVRNDPTDWNFRNLPAFDVGTRCSGDLSFPIDLGDLDLPGLAPDPNWNGAYSPEVVVTDAPNGEDDMFLMFYTGRAEGAKSGDRAYTKALVGLAQSVDGINWQIIRDFDPILVSAEFNLDIITGSVTQYANPTVVNAGDDEYGEPMYGMFYNQFESSIEDIAYDNYQNLDVRKIDHIAYAIRKGKAYLACSVGSGYWSESGESIRGLIQVLMLAVPIVLVLAFRFSKKKQS